LSDPHPTVRGNAATALGQMGDAAKPAVSELLRLLQDTNNYPRKRSMEVLRKIDPEAAAKAAGK
jgi:HEAT repeat protein